MEEHEGAAVCVLSGSHGQRLSLAVPCHFIKPRVPWLLYYPFLSANSDCWLGSLISLLIPKVRIPWGIPWWSRWQDSELSLIRALVPSLVRELRSYRLYHRAKKKKKKKNVKKNKSKDTIDRLP